MAHDTHRASKILHGYRTVFLGLTVFFGLLSPSLGPCETTSSRTSQAHTVNSESNSATDSDDEIDYDTIVNSLQQQSQKDQDASNRLATKRAHVSTDPFADVWMHGGFGWASSFENITDARGRAVQLNNKGIQANLGIDLFSPNWEAEGSASGMGDATDRDDTVSLKEFDLKVLFKNRLGNNLNYRIGGGLSGRYMTVKMSDGTSQDYTTPAAVATLGLDLFFARQFSFGVDASFRNSLIADTVDHSSLDAVVRVDARF